MVPLEPVNSRRDTTTASPSSVPWKFVVTPAVTNLPNQKEEITQFTFFFTTGDNGKFVPGNPIVNAKATRARAFELVSIFLLRE